MRETGLHGRETEQRRLGDFLRQARQGQAGPVLVVDGVAGVGKSRLLRETTHRARQRGLTVHHGPAGELRRLAHSAAEDRSVLVLDDADTVPAAELHGLFGAGHRQTASLLLARGTKGPGAGLEQLDEVTPAPVERLQLAPLDSDAVRRLVRDLIGVEPSAGLLDAANCAGGNPRLVVQLVRGLMEEDRIGPMGELVRLTPRRLPLRVGAEVDARLKLLSKESVQLVRVGTVLGRTFPLQQAVAMLGTSAAALLSAVDETVATGMLAFTDGGLSFEQPLVWRAVYETIPESVRTTLHQEARHLTAEPTPPAHDLVALGRRHPAPARRRATGSDTTGALRTLLEAGYVTSAVHLVGSALNQPVPPHERTVLGRVVTDLAMSAEHLAAPLADQAGPDLADADLLHRARARARLESRAQTRTTEPELERVAAMALSNLAWAEGEVREAVGRGREAVEQPVPSGTGDRPAYARLALAYKLIALDEGDEAARLVEEARAERVDGEPAALAAMADLVEASALLRTGDLEHAGQRAEQALATAERAGLSNCMTWASAAQCLVALRAGALSDAARRLARCRELEAGRGATVFFAGRRQWLDVLLHAARDEPREAAGLLATSHRHLPTHIPLLLEEPGAAAWFVRLSRRTGDRDLAESSLRAVEQLAADQPGVPTLAVAAAHARSLYECDADGLARAAADHRDAWARTCAAHDLRRLLKERRVDEHAFASPRATTWAVRHHIGHMSAVEVPASGGTDEPGPLVPAERDIAALVAQGLTNRQVAQKVHLSPHTVNYYLRRIYRKLGIRSRVELARYVHESDG
ncbi:LuxR C-terminal-related transcriptional regulator [Streptomyces bauhiniae]|uniref:helix-turn-helix transcriptional regulator n=1 Tax=Streptomyces bauhiniae TaxID=2340725 RepID=UPI003317BF6D